MIAACVCHGPDYVLLTVGIVGIAFGMFGCGYVFARRP